MSLFAAACGDDDKKADTKTTTATAGSTASGGSTAAGGTTAGEGTKAPEGTTAPEGTKASEGTTAPEGTKASEGTTAGAGTKASEGTTAGAGTKASEGTTAAGTTAAGGAIKVGLAFDTGGRGDGTFNDSAARGADQATKELGVKVDELEAASGEDRGPNLKNLTSNGNNPIIVVGFLFSDDLTKIAAANPTVSYGIVDGFVDAPNVSSLGFAEQEGSFLVGAAAALKSKTGHIGFIGGQEIDLIKRFQAGYEAGAKAVNPDIKIEVKYLGAAGDNNAWTSPDKAKEIADGWYQDDEVDIIYTAAGGSGAGTVQAAVANKKWAIGVDSDEYNTSTVAGAKDVILTSMLKRVDVAVFETIKAFKDGAFKGGPVAYDLKVDGVGYSTSGGYVDDIKDKLEGYKADIIAGKIVVPTTPGGAATTGTTPAEGTTKATS
ncbi:MAG: BMP family ABC transporter substrate-binding protein [Ilumatobacteraceae bacterium]